ncbi:U2 snRNP-associated SURP motif-containing protein isoform X1 [Pleuronectes platessa]|uniref:U2 snRNP-associated SURP motif-containing protein isoform X1 n=2 Tax=Pleuronectes platessa TaxID=8262 RepID=UPI00232A22F5|nr:U2 snRNP-associated SURP motif-containing protein isoform X1 [Pleuronectes platessa]
MQMEVGVCMRVCVCDAVMLGTDEWWRDEACFLRMADKKGKTVIKTRKEQEKIKKKEEEKAAEVFEEFLASFETNQKSGVKTFVRGGIVNATKEEEAAEVKKNKLYRPPTKFVPGSQNVSPVSSSESRKATFKRRTDEKKKSNLELFKEELKLIQEEREERHKRKTNDPGTGGGGVGGGGGAYGDLDIPLSGRSTLYDDLTVPTTTNLYISCISPKMNEELLCKEFGKYGPLASVKIMWPRTDEERNRTSNRAFVAFMTRKDAERALASLDGKTIMGFEMKLGWGKPARIPPQPLYTPVGVRATPPPPSGLPFNAQPRGRFRNDFTKPLGVSKGELDKTLSEAVVKVVIPTERNLLLLIHRMIEFVVREGPVFEAIIMNKEKNNTEYKFLFDNKSQDHVYYRWKLFSILQGESPTEWRTTDFRLFRGGSLWRPPVLNNYSQEEEGTEAEEEASPEEEVKKGQLRNEHRLRLEMLLKELTPSREDIASAMLFSLERADAAEEVVGLIAESFALLQTPLQKKIARLYLVSDILHNSCAKVAGASYYRKYFETNLTQIFADLNAAHRNIQARLQAEQFKQKVMSCFRAWEDWAIYPEPYLIHLQNIFLGFAKAVEELPETVEKSSFELDGAPMDNAPLDGLPLDRAPVDDLDGCPMGWDPLDGVPADDLDGVPLGAVVDDIDGMPLDEGNAPLSIVPLSKWEKTSDTGTFSDAKAKSKWDTVAEQDGEDEVNVSVKSQDVEEDSESDSTDEDSGSSSKYESADFQSSLRSFQMSESKRKRLRELEVKVVKFQDELESGKRQRKSGMNILQQVEHYRNKLLQKEFEKDEEKTERSSSKSKDRSKEDRRDKDRSKRSEDGDRKQGRSRDPDDKPHKSRSISPLRNRSPKRSKRSRSPSPVRKAGKSRSRSPHRSHKKTKKSKH